uniref:Uncharacterized protein n=1 Tax=viral metagenome TaxID=1070528 RepID=A0A6C0JSB5_9ZZZZ
MDVRKFQDSRNEKLDSFKKQYNFLKSEYSRELAASINETDPAQQQILTTRVQQINAQLVNELHGIIDSLNKGEPGFDAKKLDDLTADLIMYQKDYAEIEKTKDKVATLKIIYAGNRDKLKNAEYIYYIYIAILILLAFYVAYLVLTKSWSSIMKSFTTILTKAPT